MKTITMKKSLCGANGWHEDGTEEFYRVSKWITVKHNYNPSKNNSLWYYVMDGYGYRAESEKFDPENNGGAF